MTPTPPTILLVEDDAKIADMLAHYLRAQPFTVDWCTDGLDAVRRVREAPPALVLLDLMIPGLDGIGVCRAIREFSAVPLIMVTARVDETDRLQGLDLGADDYICKPFSPREVVARVRALLRRSALGAPPPDTGAASAPGLTVHEGPQQILWAGAPLPLTGVEFRLLRMLLQSPGHVFDRARLLHSLHDDWRDVSDRTIDSHIKNLRRKLEQAGVHDIAITAVYGTGYRLDAPPPPPGLAHGTQPAAPGKRA
ncbi:response regulator [Acidovorax sp. BL-A-41-H1]|uniref:response regulator n=1 Tax=Acidovorax sp. BL-A-41-H1 TaxID=3421102 RepID=UPI003F7A2683